MKNEIVISDVFVFPKNRKNVFISYGFSCIMIRLSDNP